mgnify:CR=1 FL=1
MKTRTILLILLAGVLFSCEKEISVQQSEKFVKLFGNYGMNRATDVVVLDDGGFAISGIDSLPGSRSRMMLVVTDAYGNLRDGFPRYYSDGNRGTETNTLLAEDGGQGGFLLCGHSISPGGDKDLFMVKVKRDGDTLWTRRRGTAGNETILHATEGIGFKYLVAGYRERQGERGIMIEAFEQEGGDVSLSIPYLKPFNSEDATANFILNTGESYLCVCSYTMSTGGSKDILILSFDDELSFIYKPLNDGFDQYGTCIARDTENNRFLLLGNRINAQTGNSEILLHSFEIDSLTSPPLLSEPVLLATESEIDTDLHAERLVRTGPGRFAIVGTRTDSKDNQDIFLQLLENYQLTDRMIFGSSGDQSGVDILHPDMGSLILLGNNAFEGNSMISLIKTDVSGSL